MAKTTLNARVTIVENRLDNLEATCNRILAILEGEKPVTKKAGKAKADKPATRKEALAKWEADKGITAESKAEYKAFYKREYDARWSKWQNSKERAKLTGDTLSRRNKEKHAQIVADIKAAWEKAQA